MQNNEKVSSTLALLLGLLASVSLTLAVVTDYWLYTSEPVTGSFTFNNTAYPVRMLVRLHSGLWRMCTYDSQLLSREYTHSDDVIKSETHVYL